MEQATLPCPPLGARSEQPPASRVPALLQAHRYARDPLGFLIPLQRRYGHIFSLKFPYYERIYYVTDPALVKALFTGPPEQFHAGEANGTMSELALGPHSVLTIDEEPHMRQRKLLLPPFHGERIKRHGELIRELAQKQMESWTLHKTFALRPHTRRIALAVIMRAVFGSHDEDRFERFEKLSDDFSKRLSLITTFPALRRNFGPRSPLPRFLRSREKLDQFIYEEIGLRRKEVEAGEEGHDDVLSLLLRARHDDGSQMSDEELRDELVSVLGAGHETTATGLAWAMERLLRTPRVLVKLRESVAAGEDAYLNATVKETLRARPVIADAGRRLTAPTEIGGYQLPKGSIVMAGIAALHYREDLFPEPKKFRPERFLEDRADNYAWIPFGGGVRRCIGAAFAEYEMRTVLREFVRADLSAPDPKPEAVKIHSGTLAPGKGTRVRLNRPLR
jgi:cytochrome P450